jgi:hypothetical protein
VRAGYSLPQTRHFPSVVLCVTASDNNIGWNLHLSKTGLVHAERLNIAGGHCKGCLHPIVAEVTRGFRVNAHLLAYVRRHYLVVLPSALVLQKQFGIDPGATDPDGAKSSLLMPGDANGTAASFGVSAPGGHFQVCL